MGGRLSGGTADASELLNEDHGERSGADLLLLFCEIFLCENADFFVKTIDKSGQKLYNII